MKQIPKKALDSLMTMTRKYWETGDRDYLISGHALCDMLEKKTGVSWTAFAYLVDGILQHGGFKTRATNATIYEVLKVLGYEVVDDGKEHPTE